MLLLLPVLYILERIYFSFADRFQIIDKPNQRSSHSYITRRGGGIIFPLAWILYSALNGFVLPWFTLGLVLISIVSFLDDLSEVAVLPRITTHATALFLALYEFGVTDIIPLWGVALSIFVGIAILNAVNFMDGINGITGAYAIVFWIPAAIAVNSGWNEMLIGFSQPVNYILAALAVFMYFNFRKRALCFAGDIGSVSMAFLMIGFLVPSVFRTDHNFWLPDVVGGASGLDMKYMLLLSVYGIDSFLTILHRIYLKENILKGHRKHLYQVMVNEAGMPHMVIALLYAMVQMPISLWVVTSPVSWLQGIGLLVAMSAAYVFVKWMLLSRYALAAVAGKPLPAESAKNGKKQVAFADFVAANQSERVVLTPSRPADQLPHLEGKPDRHKKSKSVTAANAN